MGEPVQRLICGRPAAKRTAVRVNNGQSQKQAKEIEVVLSALKNSVRDGVRVQKVYLFDLGFDCGWMLIPFENQVTMQASTLAVYGYWNRARANVADCC